MIVDHDEYNFDLDEEFLKEIHHFENFFDRMGFKRIDGAVFGLLTLASNPLRSEDIQNILSLSQSAVSQSLKTLYQFGAIETRDSKDRKCKVHLAKTDSLQIVASIFRKREQEIVLDFKNMAQRVLDIDKKKNQTENNLARTLRMKSIIKTCEMAEATINFIIGLTHLKNKDDAQAIIEKFPTALNFLLEMEEKKDLLKENILTEEVREKIKFGTSLLMNKIKGQGKSL